MNSKIRFTILAAAVSMAYGSSSTRHQFTDVISDTSLSGVSDGSAGYIDYNHTTQPVLFNVVGRAAPMFFYPALTAVRVITPAAIASAALFDNLVNPTGVDISPDALLALRSGRSITINIDGSIAAGSAVVVTAATSAPATTAGAFAAFSTGLLGSFNILTVQSVPVIGAPGTERAAYYVGLAMRLASMLWLAVLIIRMVKRYVVNPLARNSRAFLSEAVGSGRGAPRQRLAWA